MSANDGEARQTIDEARRAAPSGMPAKVEPVHPKLDAGLNHILADPSPVERARVLEYKTRGDQIQIVLVTADGAAAEATAWLTKNGATGVMSAGILVEAFVSPHLLETIAGDEQVLYVRKPLYFVPGPEPDPSWTRKVGGYTSEGVEAMNADAWHSAGFTGRGLKVAVIDSGFEDASSLIGTDLPEDRTFWQNFAGSGLEGMGVRGTACAEIIYDIAPGIDELHLFIAMTPVQTATAIDVARDLGIDVVSISLGSLAAGPGDGTGPQADAIRSFVSAGGVVTTAAGNHSLPHWQGTWSDTDNDGNLNFATGLNDNLLTVDGEFQFLVPEGTYLAAQLVWNQWSAPTTDLDLGIVWWDEASNSHLVAASTNFQDGTPGQLPIEFVNFTTIREGFYGLRINHYTGPTTVDMEMIFMEPFFYPFEDHVPYGSILVPGDTASAITAAALATEPGFPLEPFSSRGPSNGPGGSTDGGYLKPDISGYDRVLTASYGPHAFLGTAAACPHVAGAAALVWSANPGWTNHQVRSFLESHAIDMGQPGKDNDSGYGRLHLGSPPQEGCTYSISPTSQWFNPSGGSSNVDVTADAGCWWTAEPGDSWINITDGGSGDGSGAVTYSVDANPGSSSRTGAITIADTVFLVTQAGSGPPPSGDISYYSVIARTPGELDSLWVSSLSMCSLSSSEAEVVLTYQYGNGNSVERYLAIPANGIVEWQDTAFDLFGVSGDSSGVVEIEVDTPLQVAVRTYNDGDIGTFGQSLPGVTVEQSITQGETGIISPVKRTPEFRTNIGFINTGLVGCTVETTFMNAVGSQIGSPVSVYLEPGEWKQKNDILGKAGIDSAPIAYAVIRVVNSGARIWAYATVIDNATGDPTGLPLTNVN